VYGEEGYRHGCMRVGVDREVVLATHVRTLHSYKRKDRKTNSTE
jgi:hypothetical protein